MKLPRISIVTPSLNQARYLPDTIESILSQNYPNLEYMIVDGGSTDASLEIIKKYESNISYWISEKDSGQSEAIMKGFTRATGELFAWINSDDVLFPGCLDKIAEAYLKNNKPDVISTNICYIDTNGRITRFIRVPRQSRFFFYRGIWHVSAPTVFFQTSLFRDVGGLNSEYHLCMDLDLWARIIKHGARIEHIKEYLGGYRWHESSKSTIVSKQDSIYTHPETIKIYSSYIPNFTPGKITMWRFIYKLYQFINLNYIRAYLHCRKIKGEKWRGVFNNIPSKSP